MITLPPPQPRRYQVQPRGPGRPRRRLMNALSFEAAALAYVEAAARLPGENDEISLLVQDLGGGEPHCFTVNLSTGESAECVV